MNQWLLSIWATLLARRDWFTKSKSTESLERISFSNPGGAGLSTAAAHLKDRPRRFWVVFLVSTGADCKLFRFK